MIAEISIEGKLPKALGIQRTRVAAAARYFALRSAKRIGIPFREINVVLQNDAGSDEVHRGIMGVEGATDVITQRYEAIPPQEPGIYGELYVNADMALRAAPRRRGWSPAHELLLYIAHGMDHLSGEDDLDDEGYSRMRTRELRWIKDFISTAE